MLQRLKTPSPNSPLSPFVWRLVLYLYGAYIVLCTVIIGFQVAAKQYPASGILILSIWSGWIVLDYLWTGVADNYGGRLTYEKSPIGFWFGVSSVFFAGVVLLFYVGSGLFLHPHTPPH